MKKDFLALVLAAGEGTRFKSDKNKVLHTILGKSMLKLVLDSVLALKPAKIFLVVGYQEGAVIEEAASSNVEPVRQEAGLGVACAGLAASGVLKDYKDGDLLILGANLPLVRPPSIRALLAVHRKHGNSATRLDSVLEAPEAYVFKVKDLLPALPKALSGGPKGRSGFNSVVEVLIQTGKKVEALRPSDSEDFLPVRTRHDLARAFGVLRERKMDDLTKQGVTVYDPSSTWIDLDVMIGRDSSVYPGVMIEGRTSIGSLCAIYPGVHISNSRIGSRVRIYGSSVIDEATVEDDAQVGPFARLRPKTILRAGSRVGNFVELKNTDLGKGSKAMHLSYLGDSEIHEGVNIGAGTITCNYDGVKKSKTTIEAGAFIGSGTELVAPVKVGRGAYIGAGSVITKNVSPEALAVARGRQIEKPGWARRKKARS
jgi:bifunctional UDP-N-acetylglucosamine pyrophosphorylase/glucosamine-1-phosphate N-acetyltransferase